MLLLTREYLGDGGPMIIGYHPNLEVLQNKAQTLHDADVEGGIAEGRVALEWEGNEYSEHKAFLDDTIYRIIEISEVRP